MKCHTILQCMLDNGFLDADTHNPIDFINFAARAAKVLETALNKTKSPEEVSEVVGSMFDAGFCNRENQKDPLEWVQYAESAISELKSY
jgi:hypothetical protein